MPLGIFRHSNRSKQDLRHHNATVLNSESASSFEDPEAIQAQHQQQNSAYRAQGHAPYTPQYVSTPDSDQRAYRNSAELSHPPSNRCSPHPYPSQDTNSYAGSSVEDLSFEPKTIQQQGRRHTSQFDHVAQRTVAEQREKKGFFNRIRTQKSPDQKQNSQHLHNSASALARRLSKKDHPRISSTQQANSPPPYQQPQWQAGTGSNTHLPVQSEGAKTGSDLDQSFERQQQQTRLVQEQGAKQGFHSTQSEIEVGNYRPSEDESLVDQRERSISIESNGSIPSDIPQHYEYTNLSLLPQAPRSTPQQKAMASTGQGSQPRVTADNNPQPDPREARSPGFQQQYPRNQSSAPGLSPLPSGMSSQGHNYRGGPPQREQVNSAGGEQGRSTPPPATEKDIVEAFKELSQKYKKVKGLYFEKTAQVEQLQNTIANQRLSQSRTSLDDNEYMTRFQRLDGAIKDLAFAVRRDWRTIPSWIAPSVNQDAIKLGKQEMIAVGRCCISKYLVDEVFNKSFHPALDPELSSNLKAIEKNIRSSALPFNNQEESEALTSKIIQWRLATVEGLQDVLKSPQSEECRSQFTKLAISNLSANLMNYLQSPAPPGIEEGAQMIIDLAVGIAANIPMESRDICISFPMPGELFQPSSMKVIENIPALDQSCADTSENDSKSTISGASVDRDDEKIDSKPKKEKAKSGMLHAMIGGVSRKGSVVVASNTEEKTKSPSDDGPQKIRFAGFPSIEVRGRQVLGKAQVCSF